MIERGDARLPGRFWSKVALSPSGCWLWRGCVLQNGYGQYHHERRPRLVHRVAYQALVGPIAPGLQIDHVKTKGCTSRACCNPAHLEPVPGRVNIQRGAGPTATRGRAAARTHCRRGHVIGGANTYSHPAGYRRCRVCRRIREARSR